MEAKPWRWGSAHATIDITGEKGALATCNGTSGSRTGWVPAAGGEVLLPAWGVKTRAGLPLETTVRAVLSVSYA